MSQVRNESKSNQTTVGLPPGHLPPKSRKPNHYMGQSECSMHNDYYSSDVSDAVAPMGIYPEVTFLSTFDDMRCPPTIYYDDCGVAYIPTNKNDPETGDTRIGVAAVDIAGARMKLLGNFVPAEDDSSAYTIQFGYSFVDAHGRIVGPTDHGHIVMLETRAAAGGILERFRKVLDIDIFKLADDVNCPRPQDNSQTLLSLVFDYSGNLWFTTGFFRVYPKPEAFRGYFGYVSRACIDAVTGGKPVDAAEIHFYQLEPGEGAENGISSSEHGVAILTNLACYMARASEKGVEIRWKNKYESNGPNDADDAGDSSADTDDGIITGGGLSYGSGTTPTLTNDMVLFTDNGDPVRLLAFSAQEGRAVDPIRVYDNLPKDSRVSVENSILVYSSDTSRASVVICNWFGAGSPELTNIKEPKSSYDTLYDNKWVKYGNRYLHPGVARVDLVCDGGEPRFEKIWERADVRGTSIFRLSTASGILYSYDQNLESGMWRFTLMDFADGKTLMEIPVGEPPKGYTMTDMNNMAVGVLIDPRGNALYCPTNSPYMVRLRDQFVFVVGAPSETCDLGKAERRRLSVDEFQRRSKSSRVPASFLHAATLEKVPDGSDFELVFRINGLDGDPRTLTLYWEDGAGSFVELTRGWQLLRDRVTLGSETLAPEDVHELRVAFGKNGNVVPDPTPDGIRVAVVLAR